jgi:UDP:flavonoid glycosyltransferase YjiC (YdhE family)
MSALPLPPPLQLVLIGIGSRGDVQPLLALGQALRQRGHRVRIAAAPNFAAWVQALGFDFAPVGQDMQQFLANNPAVLTGDPFKAGPIQQHFFATELPRQARELLAICQDADLLVWAGLAFAAPSVAERLGIPVLGVLYTTCVLRSARHAPPTVRARGLPRWLNRALWWLHDALAARMAGAPLNRARRQLGLAPVGIQQHLQQSAFSIAMDASVFPADPAWPAQVRRANFLFLDDPEALDPALDAWLHAGEPPLYIGFGSMAGPATERLEDLLLQALASSPRRCLLATGWSGLGRKPLPAHWREVAGAPHEKLFPRVALVVHHGGSGTTASALRAGVAQVILPLILDQYHHAQLLHQAGLIPQPVAMERISAAQLRAAVETALALPADARLDVARRLQTSDGAATLVQQLEGLAGDRAHAPRSEAT